MLFKMVPSRFSNCDVLATILTIFVTTLAIFPSGIEGIDVTCPDACSCFIKNGLRSANCTIIPSEIDFKPNLELLHIDFRNHHHLKIDKHAFKGFNRLKIIHLSGLNIDQLNGISFQSLIKLEVIDLSRNRLSSVGNISKSIDRLPYLSELILRGNPLSSFPKLSSKFLKMLDLGFCNIRSIDENAFMKLPNLEVLKLDNNDLHAIENIKFPKKLISIDLSDNNIKFVWRKLWRKLKSVDLRGNPLHCNCELLHLCEEKVISSPVICEDPKHFRGMALNSLIPSQLCHERLNKWKRVRRDVSDDEDKSSENHLHKDSHNTIEHSSNVAEDHAHNSIITSEYEDNVDSGAVESEDNVDLGGSNDEDSSAIRGNVDSGAVESEDNVDLGASNDEDSSAIPGNVDSGPVESEDNLDLGVSNDEDSSAIRGNVDSGPVESEDNVDLGASNDEDSSAIRGNVDSGAVESEDTVYLGVSNNEDSSAIRGNVDSGAVESEDNVDIGVSNDEDSSAIRGNVDSGAVESEDNLDLGVSNDEDSSAIRGNVDSGDIEDEGNGEPLAVKKEDNFDIGRVEDENNDENATKDDENYIDTDAMNDEDKGYLSVVNRDEGNVGDATNEENASVAKDLALMNSQEEQFSHEDLREDKRKVSVLLKSSDNVDNSDDIETLNVEDNFIIDEEQSSRMTGTSHHEDPISNSNNTLGNLHDGDDEDIWRENFYENSKTEDKSEIMYGDDHDDMDEDYKNTSHLHNTSRNQDNLTNKDHDDNLFTQSIDDHTVGDSHGITTAESRNYTDLMSPFIRTVNEGYERNNSSLITDHLHDDDQLDDYTSTENASKEDNLFHISHHKDKGEVISDYPDSEDNSSDIVSDTIIHSTESSDEDHSGDVNHKDALFLHKLYDDSGSHEDSSEDFLISSGDHGLSDPTLPPLDDVAERSSLAYEDTTTATTEVIISEDNLHESSNIYEMSGDHEDNISDSGESGIEGSGSPMIFHSKVPQDYNEESSNTECGSGDLHLSSDNGDSMEKPLILPEDNDTVVVHPVHTVMMSPAKNDDKPPSDYPDLNETLVEDNDELSGSSIDNDAGDDESLNSSTGSYIVLAIIIVVILILIGYSVIRSLRQKRKLSYTKDVENPGKELQDLRKPLMENGVKENGKSSLNDKENKDESETPLMCKDEKTGDPKNSDDMSDETTEGFKKCDKDNLVTEDEIKKAVPDDQHDDVESDDQPIPVVNGDSGGGGIPIPKSPNTGRVKVVAKELPDSVIKKPVLIINRGSQNAQQEV